jgi:Uma2 family endonuclease
MAAPALKPEALSVEEYLALEEASDVRHELYDGVMYGMAGGSRTHAALASRTGQLLGQGVDALKCGCTVYSSDLRVSLAEGAMMYPDVTIACPPVEAPAHDPEAVANPTVVVEVLSPSTAGWDMGGKFELYRAFPSLRHYIVVSSDAWHVHHRERIGDGIWRYTDHGPGGVLFLTALGVTLEVDALYAPLLAQGGPARDAIPAAVRPRPA